LVRLTGLGSANTPFDDSFYCNAFAQAKAAYNYVLGHKVLQNRRLSPHLPRPARKSNPFPVAGLEGLFQLPKDEGVDADVESQRARVLRNRFSRTMGLFPALRAVRRARPPSASWPGRIQVDRTAKRIAALETEPRLSSGPATCGRPGRTCRRLQQPAAAGSARRRHCRRTRTGRPADHASPYSHWPMSCAQNPPAVAFAVDAEALGLDGPRDVQPVIWGRFEGSRSAGSGGGAGEGPAR
jgi:hypothetical protein